MSTKLHLPCDVAHIVTVFCVELQWPFWQTTADTAVGVEYEILNIWYASAFCACSRIVYLKRIHPNLTVTHLAFRLTSEFESVSKHLQ